MGLFRELVGRVSLDASGWQRGLRRVEKFTESSAQRLRQVVRSRFAAIFGTAAVIATTREIVRYGSKISDMAQRLGVSNEALQEQEFWVKQNGAELQDLTIFVETLNRARDRARKGQKEAIEDFAMFGMTLEDINNLSTEDKLRRINQSFMELGRNEDTIGALLRLGGESAGKLVPALSTDIDKFAQAARDLGQVMSEEVVNKLDRVSDQFDQLIKQMKVELAPVIAAMLGDLQSVIDGIRVNKAFLAGLTKERQVDWKSIATLGTPVGQANLAKGVFDWLSDALDAGVVEQTKIDRERAARESVSLPGRGSGFASPDAPSVEKSGRAGGRGDSLVSVGNFLGTDPTALSRESIQVQREIKMIMTDVKKILEERERAEALATMQRGFVG